MKLHIDHRALRATSLFASRDETRYVLNGVFLQVVSAERAILTATDGRRLFSIQAQITTDDFTGPVAVNIPWKLCATKPAGVTARKKTMRGRTSTPFHQAIVTIGPVSEGFVAARLISISGLLREEIRSMPEIIGTYPNYPAVLPKGPTAPAVGPCLNCAFIADIGRAAQILTGEKHAGCRIYGDGKATGYTIAAQWGEYEAVAVIMPMHGFEAATRTVPYWAFTQIAHQPPPAPASPAEPPRDIAEVSAVPSVPSVPSSTP